MGAEGLYREAVRAGARKPRKPLPEEDRTCPDCGSDDTGMEPSEAPYASCYGCGAEFIPRTKKREASVRKLAPGGGTHGPYYIREVDGGYVVVNAKGERKCKPTTKEHARQVQKALYVNVPEAREQAEEREGEPPPKAAEAVGEPGSEEQRRNEKKGAGGSAPPIGQGAPGHRRTPSAPPIRCARCGATGFRGRRCLSCGAVRNRASADADRIVAEAAAAVIEREAHGKPDELYHPGGAGMSDHSELYQAGSRGVPHAHGGGDCPHGYSGDEDMLRTVGDNGLTSCCAAYSTYVDDTECCKCCYGEVLGQEPGTELRLGADRIQLEAAADAIEREAGLSLLPGGGGDSGDQPDEPDIRDHLGPVIPTEAGEHAWGGQAINCPRCLSAPRIKGLDQNWCSYCGHKILPAFTPGGGDESVLVGTKHHVRCGGRRGSVVRTAGGSDFYVEADGKTAADAFGSAVDQAQWESGHGGYTGTIAEKHGFQAFDPGPHKPKEFLKGFHEWQQQAQEADSAADEAYDWDTGRESRPDYSRIGLPRPDVKECGKCGSKYRVPPAGKRAPKEADWESPRTWLPRGESHLWKRKNPDAEIEAGSPYRELAEQGRRNIIQRPYGATWDNRSQEEREAPMKHHQWVREERDRRGAGQLYAPARGQTCHACGGRLRPERGMSQHQRAAYPRMRDAYEDKWGDAVAVPLGKSRWAFMGVASS